MRLNVSLFIVFGLWPLIDSQAQEVLIQHFGQEAIHSIQGTEKLAILEFQNLNGYAVQDLSGLKDVSAFPDALAVEPLHEDTPPLTIEILKTSFPLFAYDFPLATDRNLYYRIGASEMVLVIYETALVNNLYEAENQSTQ